MVETTVGGTDRATAVPTRVLVLGMAHADGTVDAAEVFPVADACGLSADQVRSCLRRLVAEGLFVREGAGRSARYRPTADGLRALGANLERTRLAYAQDHAGRGWDRRWHLVGFAVPELQRAARDAFRDRLIELGGAAVHNGLYVSPHRWETDVAEAAGRLGIDRHVTQAATDDLNIGGEADPRAIARALWPIDDLADRYQRFVDAHSWVPGYLEKLRLRHERMADSVFLPGALNVTVEFQYVFNDDPLLPPELLPRPWPGRTARDILTKSRRLAIRLRESHDRPALFRSFDEVIESIA
ncbi:MAG: PaaX family transcriptional regulator C-terminal domain-containing protein [Acidimicrobiales bacterium]